MVYLNYQFSLLLGVEGLVQLCYAYYSMPIRKL